MKNIILFLVSALILVACGDNQRSGNRVTESQMENGSAVATAEDSISQLYNLAYLSYMEFFADLEVDYVYDEDDSGEMRRSYTFVDGAGENVTIEVHSDSSIVVRRPSKVYEISVDKDEMFVYQATLLKQIDSTELYGLVDKVKLSSFGDLQHALLLPTQMLHQAKIASIKQCYKESVARKDRLTVMANYFSQ